MTYLIDLSSGARHYLGEASTLFAGKDGYRFLGRLHPDLGEGHLEIFREGSSLFIMNLTAERAVLARRGGNFVLRKELRRPEVRLEHGDEIEVEGSRFAFFSLAEEIARVSREDVLGSDKLYNDV